MRKFLAVSAGFLVSCLMSAWLLNASLGKYEVSRAFGLFVVVVVGALPFFVPLRVALAGFGVQSLAASGIAGATSGVLSEVLFLAGTNWRLPAIGVFAGVACAVVARAMMAGKPISLRRATQA